MKPVKVLQSLFIGNVHSASNATVLKQYGIVAIVCVGSNFRVEQFPSDFKYHRVPVEDKEDADIAKHLTSVTDFIHANIKVGGVLVHCKGGICRSASFVIAYLARFHGMTVPNAHGYLKGKRSCVRPRSIFLTAIEKWLKLVQVADRSTTRTTTRSTRSANQSAAGSSTRSADGSTSTSEHKSKPLK